VVIVVSLTGAVFDAGGGTEVSATAGADRSDGAAVGTTLVPHPAAVADVSSPSHR
jgi:hypothetical protein